MNLLLFIFLISVVKSQQHYCRSYSFYSPEYFLYYSQSSQTETSAPSKISIWIDADPSLNNADVDDSIAILIALLSYKIDVVGISVIYGNDNMERCVKRAEFLVSLFNKFNCRKIPVLKGAKSASEIGVRSEATAGLAEALSKQSLVVVALGPLTNIASTMHLYPQLVSRISSLIVVAGRRLGQVFRVGTGQFGDMNFDKDPFSLKFVFEKNINMILTPWEVSSKIWIKKTDLVAIQSSLDACFYYFSNGVSSCRLTYCSDFSVLLSHMFQWSDHWSNTFGTNGFNPFDCLAIGYLLNPELFICENLYPYILTPKSIMLGNNVNGTFSGMFSPKDFPIFDKDQIFVSKDVSVEKGAFFVHSNPEFLKYNTKYANIAETADVTGTVKYCFDVDTKAFHERIMNFLLFSPAVV
jgi:inosine-uridine nucleoside N-ribohydrolase